MPIEVPRHLWYTDVLMRPGAGRIVEAGDPDAAVLMAPAGTLYTEEDAKRLGIQEYLAAHAVEEPTLATEPPPAVPEEKAVDQATVEDKAVEGPSSPPTPRGRRAVDVPLETPKS